MKKSTDNAKLVALTLLSMMLFMPPILGLFDRPIFDGMSSLSLYLFSAWGGIILLAAWIAEHHYED